MRQSGEEVAQSLHVQSRCASSTSVGRRHYRRTNSRLGANVVGVDIASNLVEAGKQRAAEEGLDQLRFQEGDACRLEGIDDHSFDLTVSVFGAMFARPFDVAEGWSTSPNPAAVS